MTTLPITGGCQCGKVRYELAAVPVTEFCHCRMCQKASGNVFAALSMIKKAEFTVTQGEVALYESSNVAKRGFCRDCGTPLTFAFNDRDRMEVTTGSLDHPEDFPIAEHFGVESRLPWLKLCDGLPEHRTDEQTESPVNQPGFASHQGAG